MSANNNPTKKNPVENKLNETKSDNSLCTLIFVFNSSLTIPKFIPNNSAKLKMIENKTLKTILDLDGPKKLISAGTIINKKINSNRIPAPTKEAINL
jgi:hypothetical protein